MAAWNAVSFIYSSISEVTYNNYRVTAMPVLAITVFDAFKGETNWTLCERFERHIVQHSRTEKHKHYGAQPRETFNETRNNKSTPCCSCQFTLIVKQKSLIINDQLSKCNFNSPAPTFNYLHHDDRSIIENRLKIREGRNFTPTLRSRDRCKIHSDLGIQTVNCPPFHQN